jgi:hypothetical protein
MSYVNSNPRFRPCATCGATGHREDSELCPYKKVQERQDPFGLDTGQPRRRMAPFSEERYAVQVHGPARLS